jgi:predicted MFS family arabinose efflux permease
MDLLAPLLADEEAGVMVAAGEGGVMVADLGVGATAVEGAILVLAALVMKLML